MSSATSASLWAVAGGAGTRGISFLVFLFIARQLSPADMGVMAIAMAFSLFMDALNELGMPDQIVRFKGSDTDAFVHSVFWMQLCMSVFGAGLLLAWTPWLVHWYAEPQLTLACSGVALAGIFTAASQTPLALLHKHMAFRAIAIRNTMATLVGGAVGLFMAYTGHGLVALVVMHVVNALTGLVVAFWSSAWRPAWHHNWHSVRTVWPLAWHSMGTRLLETVTSRLDQLMIGAFFGTTVLGFYALAVRFFDVIFQTICGPIAAVLFSFLAEKHDEPEALRQRYLMSLRNLALFAPVVFLMAALVLPELLGLLFGPKWAPVTPYLHIILGAGVVLAVTFSHTAVFSAIGQPRVNFWVSLGSSFLWLGSLCLLPGLGALYAALLWVLRMALGIPVQLYVLRRVTTITLQDYAKAVAPGCLTVLGVSLLAGGLMPNEGSSAFQVIGLLAGLCVASIAIVMFMGVRYSEALRRRLASRGYGWGSR
ncbi:MAG: lipopolysaccharide biosynthesis protein [Aquabacterium sp.]|nr:lipopolysaccharide biosynthesis protein [Aquabacterium sp.]